MSTEQQRQLPSLRPDQLFFAGQPCSRKVEPCRGCPRCLDDFRLYNRALSLVEIENLFRSLNGGPNVSAGPDLTGSVNSPKNLDATVTDDGQPAPPAITTNWSAISGPGTVTFGDASATNTTMTANVAGSYQLRPTASDGQITTFDDVLYDGYPHSAPGQIQFSNDSYSVAENAGAVQLSVTRPPGDVNGAVSVSYAPVDGTAVNGSDFFLASGTLHWEDQEGGTKNLVVPIQSDSMFEGDETLTVTLSNPTGGAILGSPSNAVVTIRNDDQAASTVIANFSESDKAVARPGGIYSSSGDLGAGMNSPFTFVYDISWLGLDTATSLRITATTKGGQLTNGGGNGIAVKGGNNNYWWECRWPAELQRHYPGCRQ